MKKSLKKLLCAALSLTMVAGSIVLPAAVSAETTPMVEGDTVLNEWKFDFGSADDVAEGYTAVTPDRNYVTEGDYGFIGIDGQGHKLGNRLDGFENQEGQTIELQTGGTAGLNDGIGSVGKDNFDNAGDKYYPVRFALKVQDEQYFRIKATVTTLDPTKDANVTVYTERKHPIIKNTTVAAGETKTVEFSIRTTPIYYQKSDPQGAIADGMVNVCVLGENSALAALEIQQVETLPVMWVLGDSTVTDGPGKLPYFDLKNFTGVGTGLTLYLPRTMAMVNEGEGGLVAADNMHFNMVKSRIKEGDYMYVEYGHNHKDDGAAGYLTHLDKYYNACKAVGAKLIIVSPIERINQWDSANVAYTHSLRDFATTGEQYVADKVAGGATDIAYVDLNQYSLDFYNKIVEESDFDYDANGDKKVDSNDKAVGIKFYFQTEKDGSTDTTHPNDAGAEHLAYEFIKAAQAVTDETQAAVLAGFLNDITEETPNLISEEVIAGGLGGSSWPKYVVENLPELPVVIDDIIFNEDGSVAKVDATTRQAKLVMDAYGIIVITIKDADGNEKGKIYAVDQVDNSTGYGTQEIVNFRGDVTLAEGDTYSAIVMKALDTADGLKVDEEANLAYSAEYKPTDIETYLLPGEDAEGKVSNVENFIYYGQTELTGNGKYVYGGSSGSTLTLGTDANGVTYSTIASDGGGNSWYVMRPLENLPDEGTGCRGKYLVSMDMIYDSGSGLSFHLAESTTPAKSPFIGDNITLFTVGSSGDVSTGGVSAGSVSPTSWTNVQYIIDMDLGKAELSVGGGTPVVVDVPTFQTIDIPTVETFKHFVMSGARTTAFNVKLSNLTVAKLKDVKLPEYTLKVAASNDEWGTVEIVPLPTATPEAPVEPDPTPTPEIIGSPLPATEPPATTDEPTTDEPVTVLSGDGITMTVEPGKATITSAGERNAVLVEAVYEDGALKSVKTTNLTFGATSAEQEVAVAEGSKLMLWDSLAGMKPLVGAEAVPVATPTPEPTPEPTPTPTPVPTMPPTSEALTAELNTVMTVKATANKGYVFMGWLDFETNELLSEEAEYSFRLREDTNLIANFVKEPGVEEVKSFGLAIDKASAKIGAQTTVNVNIIDAVDAAGTPIAAVTDEDGIWTCDDEAISVVNGVVTIPENYTTTEAKKIVTVSCELNGVKRDVKIKLFATDYYEDFTNVASVAEWITDTSTNPLSAIIDTATDSSFAGMTAAGNGKAIVIGNNSNGAGKNLAYSRDMGLNDKSVLKFGFDIEPHQIRSDGKNASVTLQFVDTDGTKVFDISVHTGGKNSSFNGTEVNGFVNGTVVSVDTVLDFTNKTMTYTLTNSAGTVLTSGNAALTANNLDKMSFTGEWQYGKFALDNVYADYE